MSQCPSGPSEVPAFPPGAPLVLGAEPQALPTPTAGPRQPAVREAKAWKLGALEPWPSPATTATK